MFALTNNNFTARNFTFRAPCAVTAPRKALRPETHAAIIAELAELGMMLPLESRADLVALPELDTFELLADGSPFAADRHYKCQCCGLMWNDSWGTTSVQHCPSPECETVNSPYKTTNLFAHGPYKRLWALLPE